MLGVFTLGRKLLAQLNRLKKYHVNKWQDFVRRLSRLFCKKYQNCEQLPAALFYEALNSFNLTCFHQSHTHTSFSVLINPCLLTTIYLCQSDKQTKEMHVLKAQWHENASYPFC